MTADRCLTYGSLFTGIGGFDLGFDRSGMRGIWQVERDKDCNRVLGKQWPSVQRGTDVCEVTRERFGAVDVICGGFPCQDVSVAGKRAGLAGARSGLWSEFHRIIEEFKPRLCVIENVPGLFSSHGGLDFLTIIRGLAKLGYCVAGAVLDSQYRGVAQRRDRVFIIGSLGNGSCAEILFEPESVRGDSAPSREARKEIAGTIGGSSQSGGFRTTDLDNNGAFVVGAVSSKWAKGSGGPAGDECQNLVTHSLSAEGADASEYGTGRGTPLVCAPLRQSTYADNASHESQLIAFSCKDYGADAGAVSPTLRSMEFDRSHINGGGQLAVAFQCQGSNVGESGALRRGNGNVSGGVPFLLSPGMSVRRLTPRECERLQGFPDDWTRWDADGKEISDSARYRMLGNAVTVTQAEWIGGQLMRFGSCLTAKRCHKS